MKTSYWKALEVFGSGYSSFEEWLDGRGGEAARAQFLEEARLDPPDFLRVIDCELSVREQAVVIIDCPIDVRRDVQATAGKSQIRGYTAISHTYGQDVYDAFDCGCAADCWANVARADPTKRKSPCKHDDPGLQQRVIGDVLGMCRLLVDVGVRYAWHDGVCIAQYDDKEVKHFIEHIAWIYANADDTVIFLHYIGRPMGPIAPASYEDGPISRWQTRVWTFQEAVLSKHRRYCVRMGVDSLELCTLNSPDFGHKLCHAYRNFKHTHFELKLASWYEPDGPNCTVILDEPEFLKMLLDIMREYSPSFKHNNLMNLSNSDQQRLDCLITWVHLVKSLRFSFPTMAHALESCTSRESKHEGDRINSILGLARVKGFSAHKDDDVESSTMEFFKRTGKAGLALALFTLNRYEINDRPHRWYPTLSSPLMFTPSHFCPSGPNFHTNHLEFEVSDDGNLEVRGPLACVSLHVTTDKEEFSRRASIMTRCSQSLSAFVPVQASWFSGICSVWLAKDNCRSSGLLGTAKPALNQTLPNVQFGKVSAAHPFIVAFGQDLNRNQNFNLIFPAELIESASTDDVEDVDIKVDEEDRYLWKSNRSFAAVMVRGEVLSSQLAVVEKVGCFIGSPMLLQLLQEPQGYLTRPHKLVIK